MSGLETAIRNALDRSDRTDGDTRARIYQSARQALDAGLQRQGVTDMLIILQQRKRLEEKIREIETEEASRAAAAVTPDPVASSVAPAVSPVGSEPKKGVSGAASPMVEPAVRPAGEAVNRSAGGAASGGIELGGVTREPSPEDEEADAILGLLGETRGGKGAAAAPGAPQSGPMVAERRQAAPKPSRRQRREEKRVAEQAARKGGRRSRGKPRRSLMSRFLTWVVTLIIVAGGCWWFYTSGMVQSVVQDALQQANEMARGQNQGNSHFDPRGGFSDDWVEIFKPSDAGKLVVGAQARAESASGSEGPAVRLMSAVSGEGGDIVVPVPADLLRAMAGKRSTIALTMQAGLNEGVQVSVGCDFGGLGTCPRHRFTATQENFEALFKVNFENATASNGPGRIIINAGLSGANKPVYLYDLRILPGQ